MIFKNVIFKRDSFINTRVPKQVKSKFDSLAKSKGKSKSKYLLELVLKELESEGIQIQAIANNAKN